ncbi:hypothetical protein EYF80_066535 [Liparis tanakae]|uniref:Uncharacterized protein n=1 Tax=Liparis tanakae TaxID=230148 RepID=A0A4Z2E362_9TELE|nr:hypothetical protein EYF80_066535 [Liparis tanakae]
MSGGGSRPTSTFRPEALQQTDPGSPALPLPASLLRSRAAATSSRRPSAVGTGRDRCGPRRLGGEQFQDAPLLLCLGQEPPQCLPLCLRLVLRHCCHPPQHLPQHIHVPGWLIWVLLNMLYNLLSAEMMKNVVDEKISADTVLLLI